MRGRDVLLVLVACLALEGVARAAPATSEDKESPEAIQGLLAALNDPDEEVVALALMLLDERVTTHPEVRQPLRDALEQPRSKEALKAGQGRLWKSALLARGLLGMATQDECAQLGELLDDPDSDVGQMAAAALGTMGAAARKQAPRLIERLADPAWDSELHEAAAKALGRMGMEEAVEAEAHRLAGLLADPDPFVRLTAAEGLGHLGVAARVQAPRLAALLEDPTLRDTAAEALRRMGAATRAHAHRLGELLRKAPNSQFRAATAAALGHLGAVAREEASLLVELLEDPSPTVRAAAAEALGNLGAATREQASRIVELLADSASEDSDAVSEAAAMALGKMGAAATTPQASRLGELLASPNWRIRRAAEVALGQMGVAAQTQASRLAELLEQPGESNDVVVRALDALGNMGEAARPYVPRLIRLLEDADEEVAEEARDALVSLAPLALQDVAALVVYAEKAPAELPMGLVRAYMAGGGSPKVGLALPWLGRKSSALPTELSLDEARATLRVFQELWPATRGYPLLRDELARQMDRVATLQRGRWTKADHPLLGELEKELRPSHRMEAERLHAASAAVERWESLKHFGWGWAGHLAFWLLLIFLYPRSPRVQALFFWNPWGRRLMGFGYVGLLLTWVPFLRRRLLAPFRPLLVADADLGHFQLGAYFERSEVLVAATGMREPLLRALPGLRGQVVLEGASGLGKSMFIRYLLCTSRRLAVYLTAERCAQGVLEAIQAKLEGQARDASFLQSLIYSGALDIYIDGLNEVASDTRARIVQFVEPKFHGNILLATQPMEWKPPPTARLYELQPLTEEQISEFLFSREPLLEARGRLRGAAYHEACSSFLTLALSPGQPEELRAEMLGVLSNPMDLTVVAQMLSEGHTPDLFHLRQQQYALMERDYQKVNGTEFPLEAFSEEAYRMKLEGRAALPEEKFALELARMESFKMVVRRRWQQVCEWHFRHDKIRVQEGPGPCWADAVA